MPGERAQAINEKLRKEHAKLVPRKAHSFGQVLTLFRSRGSRFSEFSLEQSEPKRSRCRGVLHSCSLPVVDMRARDVYGGRAGPVRAILRASYKTRDSRVEGTLPCRVCKVEVPSGSSTAHCAVEDPVSSPCQGELRVVQRKCDAV